MNGGIIGVPNASKSGLWTLDDVFLGVNNIRIDVVAGLLHRWPLTANANDIVGTLNLTNNGDVTFSANGADFNGTNQWLSCTKTRPTQFTMTAWVTPVNFSKNRCAFCASSSSFSTPTIWGMRTGSSLTSLAACVCNNSALIISDELTITNYPTDVKTLMTLTYDGSRAKAYRGASLLGSVALEAGTGSPDLSIGRVGAYSGYYWYGTIADVRLYSRALAVDEIAVLAGNGPNP